MLCLFISTACCAQKVSGKLTLVSNQEIQLEGYNGVTTYTIATTKVDSKGNFKLEYSTADFGMGSLKVGAKTPRLLVLSGEDIEIADENLKDGEDFKILKGKENQDFVVYVQEHPQRSNALNAWLFLDKIYTTDSLFRKQKLLSSSIQKEVQRIKKEDAAFLSSLPADSYIKWYLPTRKLLSEVATIAQYRSEEVPATIEALRAIDYSNPKLYKSGLLNDAIGNHFWLLENSGKTQDVLFNEMKTSIDILLLQLASNEKIYNEVTRYLFNLLEKRSFFNASEYLALKVLTNGSCNLTTDFSRQLETYRAMKVGTTAPDMVFDKTNFVNSSHSLDTLSALQSEYTVVIFGASWCPKCKEDLPELVKLYQKWKSKKVEIVFVSLDDDKQQFTDFAKSFPFPSYSDLKKWDSKIVDDYYVFATPTLYVLNNKREILLRPYSVQHLDVWLDANFNNNK